MEMISGCIHGNSFNKNDVDIKELALLIEFNLHLFTYLMLHLVAVGHNAAGSCRWVAVELMVPVTGF